MLIDSGSYVQKQVIHCMHTSMPSGNASKNVSLTLHPNTSYSLGRKKVTVSVASFLYASPDEDAPALPDVHDTSKPINLIHTATLPCDAI